MKKEGIREGKTAELKFSEKKQRDLKFKPR